MSSYPCSSASQRAELINVFIYYPIFPKVAATAGNLSIWGVSKVTGSFFKIDPFLKIAQF